MCHVVKHCLHNISSKLKGSFITRNYWPLTVHDAQKGYQGTGPFYLTDYCYFSSVNSAYKFIMNLQFSTGIIHLSETDIRHKSNL